MARGGAKHTPKGPASTRRDRLRKDKDGDLTMGVSATTKGSISKGARGAGKPKDLSSRVGGRKGGISANAQKKILEHVGAGDVAMREAKTAAPRGLVELKVGGWKGSKASSSADEGVSQLIAWLEKKASNRLGSKARTVKIKKSHVEGSDLMISIPAQDLGAMLRVKGWVWAGVTVSIHQTGEAAAISSQTAELKDMIKNVLERRYNMDEKMLDLSALGSDPDLQAKAVFNQKSTTSKFFPAMMKILEDAFDTPKDKDEAIISVSLANNELSDLSFVTTLSHTLPKLKNLDLSNNKFASTDKLSLWRRRFPQLSHIIVSGNPLEQNEPEYVKTLSNWYPKLKMINTIQVRTDEDIANSSKHTELPFPVRSPSFQDEGGIAENFIRTFFAGFDADRNTLVGMYYDAASTFSIALNTGAPRDPANTTQTEKQEWDHYIKHSRNLKKVTHIGARTSRLCKGQNQIAETFASLPKSKHPDLATEARKWLIEAHLQPGVPDASSANGVDGFMITIHGEYDEVDPATQQIGKKRSFDRMFILGPGGPSGVRVVNDTMTVRAYGGFQAFEPEQQIAVDPAAQTGLPAGLTVEVAASMVTELQKQTMMTPAYAKDCLEQVGWNFDMALQAFASVKASLPPDAFIVQQIA